MEKFLLQDPDFVGVPTSNQLCRRPCLRLAQSWAPAETPVVATSSGKMKLRKVR
jgi:hypothetical protein